MRDLERVRQSNKTWFNPRNKEFFGDISYHAMAGKESKELFLVQYTDAWTDMFGGDKRPHYRIHTLKDGLVIDELLDDQFETMEDVENFLQDK